MQFVLLDIIWTMLFALYALVDIGALLMHARSALLGNMLH
jgi:hypothetical protein